MTRRSALAQAGAPLLAAASPLQFGFSLYGMKSIPVRQALDLCARIGYRTVELALMPGWDTEPKLLTSADRREIRDTLSGLGLSLASVMESLKLLGPEKEQGANLDRLRAAAASVAQEASPGKPAVIETIIGGRPSDWNLTRYEMAEELKTWAMALSPLKTVVAIKPHVTGAMNLPDRALWMVKQVVSPWVKLVYDYSHYELHGLDMKETMRQLAGDSVFVHIKDSAGSPEKFQLLLPGDGRVDYRAYTRSLVEAGYRGPVVVEVSAQIFNQPGYNPVHAARHCFEKVSPAFR